MGVIFLRTADGLAHDRMDEAAFHLHHHRLGVLVADNDALQHALWHNKSSILQPALRRCSVKTVSMRAIVRRTSRTRLVFSSWPLARWKRRLNDSFFSFTSSVPSSSAVLPRNSSAFDEVFAVFLTALVFFFAAMSGSQTRDELGRDRQLRRAQTHRFLRRG